MKTVETGDHPLCLRMRKTRREILRANSRGTCARLIVILPAVICVAIAAAGCALQEIRSKSKFGPEFRHSGSDRTNAVRWYAQQGFDFIWSDQKGNKITSGITYRRRDVDEGGGDNDNGIWLDFSFPIWRAPSKANKSNVRICSLEERIAMLESILRDQTQTSLAREKEKGVTP